MPTVVVRVLLLHPVILGGIFLLLAPVVAWLVNRFLARGARVGATFSSWERTVGVLAAVVLLAGSLSLLSARFGAPLGDAFRLRALQRSALAHDAPPGVRLLTEREHVSTYIGLDEYTADEKDPPQPSMYERAYRVEGALPDVIGGFERLTDDDGWTLIGASCPERKPNSQQRFDNTRRYERRLSGFRATLAIWWVTTPSTVFPGAAMSNVHVHLEAPSVLASEPLRGNRTIDGACLGPPASAPLPPPLAGACAEAGAKLAAVVPGATTRLVGRPLRMRDRPADLRQMRVKPADDQVIASDPPSEPREMLERHGAVDGYQAYDRASGVGGGGRFSHREATYAYQFPTPVAARAFHEEAVARACAQAVEAFDVPGALDAVGLRLYVPATGAPCDDRNDLQWGIAFGGGCDEDWVVEYVAFVRGQYHVSVAVGDAEQVPIDLARLRQAALTVGLKASVRACEVADDPAVRRTCTSLVRPQQF